MAIRDYFEYALVAGLVGFSRILPERVVYSLFKGVTKLLYLTMVDRRRITLTNIGIAFPQMSNREKRTLAKKSFIGLAESLALNMLILTGRLSDQRITELVEPGDWEAFERKVRAYDRGLLLITGHLGNWELLSQLIGMHFKNRLHVVARESNNLLLEQRVLLPFRQRSGIQICYKKNALMHIVKAAKKGDICALLIDQKLKPRGGGFMLDFFGKPAPTGGSPAHLQIRFGIPVQPVFLTRSSGGRYRMLTPDPIPWEDNGKPEMEQVQELTRLHQGLLEEVIRAYPEQWFWMHNRWGLKKEER